MLITNCRYSYSSMNTADFKDKVLSLSDRIYSMASRLLENNENAEDAVQEIMIKLWDRRMKIGNHPNIPGFVILTARNHCIDLLKKKTPSIYSSDFQMSILSSETDQNEVEWTELTTIIEDILKEIPKQQREIMIMRDIDGFEFVEIAAFTELKVEHVRVLLSRARKHVSTKLKSIYKYD